jgi:hypothetical protein
VSYPALNRYYEDTKTASAPSRLRIALGVRFLGLLSLSWRPRAEGKARDLGSWILVLVLVLDLGLGLGLPV